MKFKKPFLIVCAATLTLALALPFMGVFAFAETSSLTFVNTSRYTVKLSTTPSLGVPQVPYSDSVSVSPTLDSIYALAPFYSNGSAQFAVTVFLDSSLTLPCSTSSSDPSIISPNASLYFSYEGQLDQNLITYYFKVSDPPPDPLAPVSDGMDTMISVFGDVIDYIINTPDVAIFVAISVASCAIIPMGIILIKKLIKGY